MLLHKHVHAHTHTAGLLYLMPYLVSAFSKQNPTSPACHRFTYNKMNGEKKSPAHSRADNSKHSHVHLKHTPPHFITCTHAVLSDISVCNLKKLISL